MYALASLSSLIARSRPFLYTVMDSFPEVKARTNLWGTPSFVRSSFSAYSGLVLLGANGRLVQNKFRYSREEIRLAYTVWILLVTAVYILSRNYVYSGGV